MLLRLIVAVEPAKFRRRLAELLRRQDLLVDTVEPTGGLVAALHGRAPDLVLVTRSLLAPNPGTTIREISDLPERPGVIVFESDPDEKDRAELLALGCLAVLSGSLADDILSESLDTLIRRHRQEAIDRLSAERPEQRYSLADFVSDSPAMQRFVALARKVVRSDTSVLVLGETGVGKERLARAIHAESPRSSGPFVAVHCAALPEALVESELFGHEAGAFTGATRAHKGYFELAHMGTLLLDEVGEIPPNIQVKLLRVLEESRIRRVGGEKPIPVNVRIIAATNRDVEAEIARDAFRPDLFYRLSVITLGIPPLRERREDIGKLVLAYLEHFRQQTGRSDIAIEPDALDLLVRHDWPGNVRELINAVEQAVLLCSENRITTEDLPRRIVNAVIPESGVSPNAIGFRDLPDELLRMTLPEARAGIVSSFERAYVTRQLQETGGRIGETARRAGINQRHLYDLMRRLGLRKEDFKAPRE